VRARINGRRRCGNDELTDSYSPLCGKTIFIKLMIWTDTHGQLQAILTYLTYQNIPVSNSPKCLNFQPYPANIQASPYLANPQVLFPVFGENDEFHS
jgi:hypothetical protein